MDINEVIKRLKYTKNLYELTIIPMLHGMILSALLNPAMRPTTPILI